MLSYNQPNNQTKNNVVNSINNELLQLLNQNKENMHNALLRRVEPQREPINVHVNNPPIDVNNPPINITHPSNNVNNPP